MNPFVCWSLLSAFCFAASCRPRQWDLTSHGWSGLKPEPWEAADQQPAGGCNTMLCNTKQHYARASIAMLSRRELVTTSLQGVLQPYFYSVATFTHLDEVQKVREWRLGWCWCVCVQEQFTPDCHLTSVKTVLDFLLKANNCSGGNVGPHLSGVDVCATNSQLIVRLWSLKVDQRLWSLKVDQRLWLLKVDQRMLQLLFAPLCTISNISLQWCNAAIGQINPRKQQYQLQHFSDGQEIFVVFRFGCFQCAYLLLLLDNVAN